MSCLTIADIAKFNGSDAISGLIDETIKNCPEVYGTTLAGQRVPNVAAARTIKGLNYRTLVRTALPTVSFRAYNSGTALGKSTWENRLVETYLLNPSIEVDKQLAQNDEDGAAACIAKEASGIWLASMYKLASCFYYGTGTGGDTLAFPGLVQAYDTTNMEVDAGGTTPTTGSSVYAVRFGVKDVIWVYGLGGQIQLSDVVEARVLDGSNYPYTVLRQEVVARVGLQVGRSFSVGRIKKLTADSGCGLTDALLGTLLSKFKVGYPPDVFLMSKRSLEQLRKSRTAVNVTGTPAPTPTEFEGIPIMPTESILNTEALTL
jgi:hypothetical protein